MTDLFPSDGCTLWFDGDWVHCCTAHDAAYASGMDKLQADLELAVCVAQTGNGWMAVLMLLGLLLMGWPLYRRRAPRLPPDDQKRREHHD